MKIPLKPWGNKAIFAGFRLEVGFIPQEPGVSGPGYLVRMRLIRIILNFVLGGGLAAGGIGRPAWVGESGGRSRGPGWGRQAEEQGLTPGRPQDWPHWIVLCYQLHGSNLDGWAWPHSLCPICHPQNAARPSGAQNFLEWLVETLYEFLESIIGSSLVKRTFWFFATVFIFILFTNWFGLIPGVGTIGWGSPERAWIRGRPRCSGAATPT